MTPPPPTPPDKAGTFFWADNRSEGDSITGNESDAARAKLPEQAGLLTVDQPEVDASSGVFGV